MFPWQSGSDGREETQVVHLNPISGRWLPDGSHLQRHIGIAIAWNVWHYVETTGDDDFLARYGAELLLDIARFFASKAEWSPQHERYRIRGVMGPDEYHESYPDRAEPGLDDNAYTNVMTAWLLRRALDALDRLPAQRRHELEVRLDLGSDELARIDEVSRRLRIPFVETDDGTVIEQFEGYAGLLPFDWDGYRQRYGDISRLDRILEAEGDATDRYQVSKQADVLMLFYLLTTEQLEALWRQLGYEWDPDLVPRTVRYSLARTSHGSTLSRVVTAWVLARGDRAGSWRFFTEALASDIEDIQGGTTAEGIHLGAMAGTVDLVQRGYTGMRVAGGVLLLDPALPDELRSLRCTVRIGPVWGVGLEVRQAAVEIRVPADAPEPVRVQVCGGEVVAVGAGEDRSFPLTA
jgi:trehalose/maltose hydrolase-like predicted phosphorylase